MGFELGAGPLRRAPRGWLPARAFALRHSIYSANQGHDAGESMIDLSSGLRVLWRVEVQGRAPYELEEDRNCPTWLDSAGVIGGGKRWYKVRVRPQYGLMPSLGVPGVVDPSDPAKLWIDWDAAYEEHIPAWEQEARVRREVDIRRGGIDAALRRIPNPLAGGKLQPGDERIVEERLAPEVQREEQQRDHLLAQMRGEGPPPSDEEYKELLRLIDEQRRLQRKGRQTTATVVAREETDRTFATIPVVMLEFDVEGRAVRFEHVFGPGNAEHYQVGTQVGMWVDPKDPDRIAPGR